MAERRRMVARESRRPVRRRCGRRRRGRRRRWRRRGGSRRCGGGSCRRGRGRCGRGGAPSRDCRAVLGGVCRAGRDVAGRVEYLHHASPVIGYPDAEAVPIRWLLEPRSFAVGSTDIRRRCSRDQELATGAGGIDPTWWCSGCEIGRCRWVRIGDGPRSGACGIGTQLGLVGADGLGRCCKVRLAGCHPCRAHNALKAEDHDCRQNPEDGQSDEQLEKGESCTGSDADAHPAANPGAEVDRALPPSNLLSPPRHLLALSLHLPDRRRPNV